MLNRWWSSQYPGLSVPWLLSSSDLILHPISATHSHDHPLELVIIYNCTPWYFMNLFSGHTSYPRSTVPLVLWPQQSFPLQNFVTSTLSKSSLFFLSLESTLNYYNPSLVSVLHSLAHLSFCWNLLANLPSWLNINFLFLALYPCTWAKLGWG